ncbi:MAG: hypothetical protein ACE5FS_01635 [Paracoccaceae bacterium]
MLIFFNLWTGFSLLLFYAGPIPWEGARHPQVAILVVACLAGFDIAALSVRRPPVPVGFGKELLASPGLRFAVIAGFVVLSYLHLKSLTGLSIFDPADYSFDFGDIYANYTGALEHRTRAGLAATLLMLLKAAIFPALLLILMRDFAANRLTTALIFFPFVASSMMRGTDKEFFDIGIFILLLGFYHGMLRRRFLVLVSVVPVILLFFLERKVGRFGGFMPPCLPGSVVCFDFSSSLAAVSPALEVLYVMLSNYLTQGYQGLHLALGQGFEANFGLGHLPPVKRILCDSFDVACGLGDFQDKLTRAGWDARRNWVSVYTVIANDTHWLLLPAYFGFLGFLFRVSEIDWQRRRDPFSLGTVVTISILLIYASANMQVAVSVDWVFATCLFVYGQSARIVLARGG